MNNYNHQFDDDCHQYIENEYQQYLNRYYENYYQQGDDPSECDNQIESDGIDAIYDQHFPWTIEDEANWLAYLDILENPDIY